MERLLRPYGLVIDGTLELGLELLLVDGIIREIRPHTGIPESYAISPAFVNAHSHLEYRGLQGFLKSCDYWPWIREITQAKREQNLDQVREDTRMAARENRATGVAVVAEHSDRPFAAQAMKEAGLAGVVFQEVITRFESAGPSARFAKAALNCEKQRSESGLPCFLAAHAYQTVDEETLRWFARSREPFSMHVAETDLENELSLTGEGPIGETFRSLGVPFSPTGKRLIPTLAKLGLVRSPAQFIHCCAVDEADIALMASHGVTVAHCPRSNENLRCPPAPVREMLDAGIAVGLGLDSAASSGPIDMFAEMRSALAVSIRRGLPLAPEAVWSMATHLGAKSLRPALPNLQEWEIRVGSSVPLIAIHVGDAYSTEDLISRSTPASVEWLSLRES
ncbi:MAG TPA: amidohydrolase family protein [Fimbriimonadaceae bacterium]|nr:amidohydrolase family protein [Fimbriimonadaceae bacterium]